MNGSLFCLISFATSFFAANRRLDFGLIILFTWGYFFGILKANFIDTFGLFIFDAATIGFYAGLVLNPIVRNQGYRFKTIIPWMVILIGWPVFMAIIPIQHYLVQIIGLRGNIFWLPMVMVGILLSSPEKSVLVFYLALLNMVSFAFAVAEFFVGVEYFIPESDVTRIVYDSNDLKDGARRIPSIFANAHSYALFMFATLPWIIGEIIDSQKKNSLRLFTLIVLMGGVISALVGIFMAGPRQPVIALGMLTVLIVFSRGLNLGFIIVAGFATLVVGYLVSQDERMQRFTTIQDFQSIQSRIQSSLNMSFFEVLMDYPMGNGMGGGGTSLPFFAQQLLNRSIILENEYSRILLEQGLPGLIIFLAFFAWFMKRQIQISDLDYTQKKYVRLYSFVAISTAFIGIGLMTSIPGAAFLLLGLGYCTNRNLEMGTNSYSITNYTQKTKENYIPAYQRGLGRA